MPADSAETNALRDSACAPRAAYCDVDGTLSATNIVTPLAWHKRRLLPPPFGRLWPASLLVLGPWWLLLDRLDRMASNRSIYACYRGLNAQAVREQARACYAACIEPRLFPQALAHLEHLRQEGFRLVLVTGSLDFMMQPLAERLHAELAAPSLEEQSGRFTGKILNGPLAGPAKAEAVRAHGLTHGIDLAQSQALGDSWGDLPMLECVGHPVAVNADNRLKKAAEERGWPQLTWR